MLLPHLFSKANESKRKQIYTYTPSRRLSTRHRVKIKFKPLGFLLKFESISSSLLTNGDGKAVPNSWHKVFLAMQWTDFGKVLMIILK
jgi:hypothetical protein